MYQRSKIGSYISGASATHRAVKFSKGAECIDRHVHEHIELIFVESGCYQFGTHQYEGEFKAGDVFIANRGEPHWGKYLGQGTPDNCYHYLQLDVDQFPIALPDSMKNILDAKTEYCNRVAAEDAKRSGLWEYGLKVLRGICVADARNDAAVLANTILLLTVLQAHWRSEGSAHQDSAFVRQVSEYVDRHYAEPISTRVLAQYLGYDKSYFCRKMQKEFKGSFSAYLRAVRVKKFLSLPALSLQTIALCAESVGFNDYSHFYHSFIRIHKISPREYLIKRARESGASKH